jgi:hypothetical protein
MSSAVEICNRGLTTYLGLGTITSLADSAPAAVQCNLHYGPLRQKLISAHEWVFATDHAALALLTNDRDDWDYRYAKPGDALEVRWVNVSYEAVKILKAANQDHDTARCMTATDIYSDVENAVCEYTIDVEDPTLFPPHFQDALAAAIAAAVAMPLTQDTNLARFARMSAEEELDRARAIDERQKSTTRYDSVADFHSLRGVS